MIDRWAFDSSVRDKMTMHSEQEIDSHEEQDIPRVIVDGRQH